MLTNPPLGFTAQVWYRKRMREFMPYHGRTGKITIVGRGKPRNHGIEIDGKTIVVPAGNLRKPKKGVNV